MKTTCVLLAVASFTLLPVHAATVVFADNFDAPDTGNLDLSDQTGRRSGLDPAIQSRSSRIQHGIVSGQLDFLSAGTGRLRFHDDPDNNTVTAGPWHDWATGAGSAAILGSGGMRVQFDWIAGNATSDNWVAFNVGHSAESAGEPVFRVNDGATDFGILFRFIGGTQVFDNGVAAGASGLFPPVIGSRQVTIDYSFSSFADGSNVGIAASVDGTSVYNGSFQWAGNSGGLYMELETLENTRIDNLSISSIPEPSVAALGLLCGSILMRRRRRA